jgi:micrococcal nuclease
MTSFGSVKKASPWGAFFICAFLALTAAAESVRVERALDGDSLLLADGRQVRLIGINAPEFGKDGSPPQPLAVEAYRRLSQLLERRSVLLRYSLEKSDRYGRVLAYAFTSDGQDVQALLLREGLAWFVAIPPNTAHAESYRGAESEARAKQLGIWGRTEYTPVSAERLTSSHSGFLRVRGTVSAVVRRRNDVELVLTPHMSLLVAPSAGMENVSTWTGRGLIARGWLTRYNGRWRMRVTHSSMLEQP